MEMPFPEHDDVVEAFSPDRANQAFGMGIQIRTFRRQLDRGKRDDRSFRGQKASAQTMQTT